VFFILEIESKLDIQINDEVWERMETVGELIQTIKINNKKYNTIKLNL